jgi:hypothetical protein
MACAISDLVTTAQRTRKHVTPLPIALTAQTQTRIQTIVATAALHVLLASVVLASVVPWVSALVLDAWNTALPIRTQTSLLAALAITPARILITIALMGVVDSAMRMKAMVSVQYQAICTGIKTVWIFNQIVKTAVHVAMYAPLDNAQLVSVAMWGGLLVETRVLPILILI